MVVVVVVAVIGGGGAERDVVRLGGGMLPFDVEGKDGSKEEEGENVGERGGVIGGG